MTPSSVPGSVSGCPSPPAFGLMVVTYCFACSFVAVSKAPAWKLRNTSTTTPPIRRTLTIPPTMNLARFNTADDSTSGISGTSFGGRGRRRQAFELASFETPVDTGEDHRHEEQCGNRREQQSPDHRTAQRCVLFGPFAQSQRHGDHTDDHGHGGHQDGTYAGRTRIERRLDGALPLAHA